jgi:two-component sensor histidine kinase
MRVVPLLTDDRRAGAVVLVRDVTDLRRLDRQLMSKDATIREIHHRVKNNLQMVAALLRMQARRVGQPEARAALEESERRVAAIATVHELLSATPGEEADFDAALERIVAMVRQLVPDEAAVRIERRGTVGMLPAAVAMPLAMVVTELLQNAAQHAVPGGGRIAVESFRPGGALRVMISDDGPGLPDGFSASAAGLGMHIVHSLVAGELSGRLVSRPAVPHGTVMVVEVPLPG